MLGIPGQIDSRRSHLTTFTVKVGGVALSADFPVVSIDIRREINRIPRAVITIQDGDGAQQNFALSERAELVPGAEIEILGGYSSQETTLFKGLVTRHRVEVQRRGGSNLVVEVRDPAFRLGVGRRSRNFSDVTDADLVEQIVGLYQGLSANVASTMLSHPQVVQHQSSDWDFLVMRAEFAGLGITCADGVVSAQRPAVAGIAAARAIFGQGLLSAELELDAESQFTAVQTGAWSPAEQELLETNVDDALTPGPGDLSGSDLSEAVKTDCAMRHPAALDQPMLDAWAAALMGRARRAAVRGRIRIQGTEALLPNTLVELNGFGSRFNGLALVSGIRHRLGRGDWTTEAIIGSDPRPHHERFTVAAAGAGGLLPPVPGLQVGIVAALDDPQGEDRIEIRLPTINETDGQVWARQALLDAGEKRGTSFRPEVGDEVIVGFLDGDPQHPIILGALHSSPKPNPLPGADGNDEKAIVTRSGMRLHWHDKDVVATIDTPAGNSIILSEKDKALWVADQHGNSIKLSQDGIALNSVKDITLTAKGDVKITGLNVEANAQATVKAQGSAGAELSSSGTTAIKGAMVNIN